MLGKGTFAQVFLGTLAGKQPTQAEYAIKVIKHETINKMGDNGEKGRRNLQNECQILNMIKHRNIVKLEEFIQTANNYYLVFEYCSGGDL